MSKSKPSDTDIAKQLYSELLKRQRKHLSGRVTPAGLALDREPFPRMSIEEVVAFVRERVATKIEGIPDGYELVRISKTVRRGDYALSDVESDPITPFDHNNTTFPTFHIILRKIDSENNFTST